jgi:hypothetical protein
MSELILKESSESVEITENDRKNLIELTKSAREKMQEKNKIRYSEARKKAIEHITINSLEKCTKATEKCYDQAILYSFGRAKDKESNTDSYGNIVKFGENVWLSDIIDKAREEFINELNFFFNKDGNSNLFHCHVYPQKDFKTNEIKQNIYVSWAEQDNEKNNSSSNIVYRGGKNNFQKFENKKKNNQYKNKTNYTKSTI